MENNSHNIKKAEFTKNPVFLCIKNAINNMWKIQQDTKEQLVSLLVTNYSKEWIHSLLSAGRTTVHNVTEILLEHRVGAKIPHLQKNMTRSEKRTEDE